MFKGVLVALALGLCAVSVSAWHKSPNVDTSWSRNRDRWGKWGHGGSGGKKWGRGEFTTVIPGFTIPGVRIPSFVEDGRFPDFGYEGPKTRIGFWIRDRFVPVAKWSGFRIDHNSPGFQVNGKYMDYRKFRREIQDAIYWRRHRDFKIKGMPPIEVDFRRGVPPFYVKGGNLEIPGFTTNGLFPGLKYFKGEPRFHIGGRTWTPAFRLPGFQDHRGVGGFNINGRFVPYHKLKDFLDDHFRNGKGVNDLEIEGFSISGRDKKGFWPGFNVKGVDIKGFAPNGVFPRFEWKNNVPGFIINGKFTPAKDFKGFRLVNDEPGFTFDGDFVRYDSLKSVLESYADDGFQGCKNSIPGFTITPSGLTDFPGYMVKAGVPGFNIGGKFVPGFTFPGFDVHGNTPGFNIDGDFVPLNQIPEQYPDWKLPKHEGDASDEVPLTPDEAKDAGTAPTWNGGITAGTGQLSIGPSAAGGETVDFPGYKVQDGVPGFVVDGMFVPGKQISNFVPDMAGLPGFTFNGKFVPLSQVKTKYPNFHIQLPSAGAAPQFKFQDGYIGFVLDGKFIPGNQFPGLKPSAPWPQVEVPGFKIPGFESETPVFTIRDFQPGFLVDGGAKFIPGSKTPGYHIEGGSITLDGAQIPQITFPSFSFELGLPAIGVA